MLKNDLFTLSFTKILKHYLTLVDEHKIPDIVSDLILSIEIVDSNWEATHRKNTWDHRQLFFSHGFIMLLDIPDW